MAPAERPNHIGNMTTPSGKPQFETADLFATDGESLPRIPGLVVTDRDTILALCNWRKGDREDFGHDTDKAR
jgi:hypothetical protein